MSLSLRQVNVHSQEHSTTARGSKELDGVSVRGRRAHLRATLALLNATRVAARRRTSSGGTGRTGGHSRLESHADLLGQVNSLDSCLCRGWMDVRDAR